MDSSRRHSWLVATVALMAGQAAHGQVQIVEEAVPINWAELQPQGGIVGPERQGEAIPVRAEARQIQGHDRPVRAVAFSPNGKLLASAGYDNAIRLWGLASGKELRCCEGHQLAIIAIAFAPDGGSLASASLDKSVRLWDVATGKEIRRFDGHGRDVHGVAISPDGKTLASAGYDGTVRLWEVASGRELHRCLGHQGEVYTVVFAPNGKTLASAGQDRIIRFWHTDSGKPLRQLAGHQDSVLSLAFSPDGKTLASASHDTTVRLWDVAAGKERRRLLAQPHGATGYQFWVRTVAFSPDGRTLASAGMDRIVHLWEVATGKERLRLQGPGNTVWTVTFSLDGKGLAAASEDHTARIWNLRSSLAVRLLAGRGPSAEELEALWIDLAGQDAPRAYQAIQSLAETPAQTVPFLREHLQKHAKPSAAVSAERRARLIADLDDDRPAVREKAMDELTKLGKAAEPALREVLAGRYSAEVGLRVKLLLDNLKGATWSPEALRRVRAVEVLEHIGSPEARRLLQAIVEEAPETALAQDAKAALERLAKRPAGTS